MIYKKHKFTKHDKPCLHCDTGALRYRYGRCIACFRAKVRAGFESKKKNKACSLCTTEYRPYRSDQKFCSQKCSDKARIQRDGKGNKPRARKCKGCEARIYCKKGGPQSRYCSPACRKSAAVNRQKTYKYGTKTAPRKCRQCRKPFEAKHFFAKTGKANYCSRDCWYDFLSVKKLRARNRKPGRIAGSGSRGRGWTKLSHRIIWGKFFGVCQGTCEFSASPYGTLACDHIVPYHLISTFDGKDANAEINLTSLCDSCHMKKTLAERKLFGGNIIGFMADARRIFRDMGPIKDALEYAGLSAPRFGIDAAKFVVAPPEREAQ